MNWRINALAAAALLAAALLPSASHAQVLFDGFNYPDGEINDVSGGGWQVQTPGGPLNISHGAAIINQGDLTQGLERVSRALDAPFTTTGNSVAYYAFTATWSALPLTTSGSYFVHLSISTDATTFYGRVGADLDGAADGHFRVSVANANWSQANAVEFPADLSLNVSYRIVVKYDLNAATTTLWIDPASEASPSVTATDPPVGTQQPIAAISLRQGLSNSNSGAPGIIAIDDLSVGSTFAQVNSFAAPEISRQPADATVNEGETAIYSYELKTPGPVTTQWKRGEFSLPSATNAVLRYGPVTMNDDGLFFAAFITNKFGSTNTTPAKLTVLPDRTPPSLLSVLNLDPVTVQLAFSEDIAPLAATNKLSYSVSEGVTVLSAAFGADARTILLATSPLKLGSNYVVTISGLTDRSQAANRIAAGTQGEFVAIGLASTSIGTATAGDAVVPLPGGGYAISSGGVGSVGGADQIEFAWQQRSGDFDVAVQLESMTAADVWAMAGLMVRETLDPGSRFAAVMATPSLSGVLFQSRVNAGSTVTKSGSLPVNYPHTWLRLRRVGNTLTGYAGFDGNDWLQLGSGSIPLPAVVYLGMTVSSHTTLQTATAKFHELRDAAPGEIVPNLSLPFEPLAACSRKTGVVISEIMYHAAPRADGRELEFVELFNSNPWPEDISGYQLAGDITYNFPSGTIIPAGGFRVVARNPADLKAVTGLSGALGPYSVNPNGPETIQLLNNGTRRALYLDIPYRNLPPWSDAADGTGHSLVLKRPSYGEGYVEAWGVSEMPGGSPGAMESYQPDPARDVVINELLTHPGTGQAGFVELYNHSNVAVDLSGYLLTDHPGNNHHVLSPNTVIPARGFLTVGGGEAGMALSPSGGALYLEDPASLHIIDVVLYESGEQGVSVGRAPDGGSHFHRLREATPGASNTPALVSDVVINELMFKPLSRLKDDEFIELYNQGTTPVDISGWKFIHGVSFTVPAGTALAAKAYLVVARNAAHLLTNYPKLTTANTLGDFSGSLSGSGERVSLTRPFPWVVAGKNGQPVTNLLNVIVDEVTYRAGGQWGTWSDGGGSSLELRDPRADHQLAPNWGDSDETQKAPWTTIEATTRLDLGATQGGSPIDRVEILMSGAGECLVDNVEVIELNSATNRLSAAASTFESGMGGWIATGDHIQSKVDDTGGVGGGKCLHVRATDRGDTMVNHLRVPLIRALSSGQTVTLRAQVRWLRGFPELVLRVKGNFGEATGTFQLPTNPGTPGERNTQYVENSGPLITGVVHSPVLPAAQQPVVVSTSVQDPDGLGPIVLHYRVDPGATYTDVAMNDTGTDGDAVSGDGVYSATIPGMAAGKLVAFYVTALDAAPVAVASGFPNDAPTHECLVRFGDPTTISSFGTYRLWLTQASANAWNAQGSISNARHPATFVYGNSRVIYGVEGKFAGSPYHQGFGSPVSNQCHYSIEMPGDDQFLGTTTFNKIHAPGNGPWEDDTLQREQTAYWMVRQLGLPWNYRRYVNFLINGTRRQPVALMEDAQTPDADVVAEQFPDDPDGHLYKLQPWFEFADNGSTFDNQGWCTLNNYVSGGKKKLARYRPNYLTRAAKTTANDYTDVFELIDTAILPSAVGPQREQYIAAMNVLVDTDEWMRIMAVEHAVGNWDSYLNSNGQNMYAYKPTADRWTLFIWDYNIVLGLGGYTDGPTGDDLFKTTGGDNGQMTRFAGTPVYRRALWRAFEELANGAMNTTNAGPQIDARYSVFRTEGFAASAPTALKSWISTRQKYLLQQLKSVSTTFAITTPTGTDYTTADNPLTLIGTAPVAVENIEINGLVYPVTWTDVRHWQVSLPLAAATNTFVVRGRDRTGRLIAGDETQLNVVYTGNLEPAAGRVAINEIMYHAPVPGAEFIELYNTAANTPYDLSNWRLDGVGFTFPAGAIIRPGGFVVVARDAKVFAATYGSGIPIAGTFSGLPYPASASLRLVQGGALPADDVLVNAVRFRNSAPWPVSADGTGSSLQLIDAKQDNARVANWAASSPGAPELATPGRANTFAQSLPPFPALWINEVLSEGTDAVTDNLGEHEPYIELYNGAHEALDLNGLSLTDNYSDLGRWSFGPGTTIAPGGFMVVWADGQPAQSAPGIPHTSWRLAPTVSSVVLVQWTGAPASPQVLDYVDYFLPPSGGIIGSIPDGQALSRPRLFIPTPGAINNPVTGPYPVVINEWMAANTSTLINPVSGQADDWFELYNAGTSPVNLGGFQLASPQDDAPRSVVPAGVVIPAGGHLLVWADKTPAAITPDGSLHVNFHLNKKGTSIGLYATNGSTVDSVTFGSQAQDVSEGRAPDGAGAPYVPLATATPAGTNVPVQPVAWFDRAAAELHLMFGTQPGLVYRVVVRESVESPWRMLKRFTAESTVADVVDDALGTSQRYYAVILESGG